MCDYFKINKIKTTSYHPQTNGLTEKFNQTLCRMLSSYTNDHQTNWDIFLPIVLFAYRTSVQKSSKESPFRLLFARDARLPSDVDQFSPNQTFINDVHEAWKEAKISIEKSQEKSTVLYKQKYEKLKYGKSDIKIGDQVRLENPVSKPRLKKKLRNNLWIGPYTVTNVNLNSNVEINNRWYHKNRVKLAEIPRNTYITRYGRETNRINYRED